MEIALITDTHYGVRNDAIVFIEHQKKFFDQIFFPTLQQRGIQTVIHLGDLVDRRKYINYNTSLRMRKDFLDRLNGIQTYIIPGNHDVFFKNTNEINALSELVDHRHNQITVVHKPAEITVGDTQMLLVPWINEQNELETFQKIVDSSAPLCFGHFELQGFEMNRGVLSDHGYDASILSKFDMVFTGHFHRKSNKGNVFYLGAPYQMTWADYDCPRGFHILNLSTRCLEFIENPHTLFTKIVYNDNNVELKQLIDQVDRLNLDQMYCKIFVEHKSNPYWFDTFVERVYRQQPYDVKIVDQPATIADNVVIDQMQDTISIINQSIDQIDLQVNKQQLKLLFDQLYKQSLSLEV